MLCVLARRQCSYTPIPNTWVSQVLCLASHPVARKNSIERPATVYMVLKKTHRMRYGGESSASITRILCESDRPYERHYTAILAHRCPACKSMDVAVSLVCICKCRQRSQANKRPECPAARDDRDPEAKLDMRDVFGAASCVVA